MKAYKHKPGLTLVEMMVVIGIIAILATMVIGIASRIDNKAREQLCESTLVILSTAIQQFQDFDYEYPNEAYGDFKFPLDCNDFSKDDLTNVINDLYYVEGAGVFGFFSDKKHDDDYSGCEMMHFFLSRIPACREALENAPAGATLNLFGGLSGGIEIDSNEIHYRQLVVHGTSGSTPEQFSRAVEMLGRRPELGDIVTDVVGFDDLEKTIIEGPGSPGLHLKAVLDPWL